MDEAAYKALILLEVGNDPTIADNIDSLWDANADQPTLYLQYLFSERSAIQVLMGRSWQSVTFRALDTASVNLSDLMKNLQAMLDALQYRIDEAIAQLNGAGAIAPLTTTAPIGPPAVGIPDGNDPRYRGDVYQRVRRSPGRAPID